MKNVTTAPNFEQPSLLIGEPASPIKNRKTRRRPKLSLTKKAIAPMAVFNQHDYVNGTVWVTWFNRYRQKLGLPKKRIQEFKRFIGQVKTEQLNSFFMCELGSQIEVELFRTSSSRYGGTWLPKMLMPHFLQWLADGTSQPLELLWLSGKWQRWQSRCFTDAENRVIPPASAQLQAEASDSYRQLCDRLNSWQQANPGASSCKGGQLFNVYTGYLLKGFCGVSLTQLKRHLMLKSTQSIHKHLPAAWLTALIGSYREAIDAIAPDLDKSALKLALAAAGESQKLDSRLQLFLA